MPLGIFDTLRTFEILRMASGVLYRSEVLFYIQNSVSSVPRDIILTTICGFYNEAEIIEAKDACSVCGCLNAGNGQYAATEDAKG